MKRKTSTVPTQIWTFGIYKLVGNAEKVHEQLKLSHVYYNQLIEIELARRVAYRAARSKISSALALHEAERDRLSGEIDQLRDEIKAKRGVARARIEDAARKKRIDELRVERRSALAKVKAERELLTTDPVLLAQADAINKEAADKQREARGKSGLYWGNYLLIEKQIEQARKSKVDPRFHRFTGTGRIGVQLQNGLPVASLFGTDPRIQLDPLPPETWDTRRGRRYARSSLRIRVGSDGIKPIFAEFKDALIHRKIPADARLMWAWVKVSKIGARTVYELQLTLQSAEFEKKLPPKGTERIAAINFGWRALDSGVRVGYVTDVFGEERTLVLTDAISEALHKASSLRAINDGHFNTARAVLKSWAATCADEVPEWLAEELPNMHAWRSRGRLARLARLFAEGHKEELQRLWRLWTGSRLPARLDLFSDYQEIAHFAATHAAGLGASSTLGAITVYLDFWRRKERHLWDWEANLRQRALRRRKDIYRNWAAELGREYAIVVLADNDIKQFAKTAEPENQDDGSPLRRHMAAAAPHELKQAILSCLGKERVVVVSDRDISRDHSCGHKNESELWKLEKRAQIVVPCEGCGVEYDQDQQAARNLLAAHLSERRAPRTG